MGEIVNLNRFRKQAARRRAAADAAENRVRFGRTGAAKAEDEDQAERSRRALDGGKLEGGKLEDGDDDLPPPGKAG